MPGYEVKFVNPLLKRHECPVCLYAMRNPVQTECGHLFCRECLDPVLKRKRPICPLDKEEINPDSIFPDNACRREILNLEVYCSFMTSGCEWIGALKNLEAHLPICEYREIQCTQCGQYIQYLILATHQEVECPMRPQPCQHCGKDVPAQQLQHHIEKLCPKVLHNCPNECDSSKQYNLEELEKHLDVKQGTCPLLELQCPYSAYGCSFVSQRKNIQTHFEQNQIHHVMIQAAFFMEIKQSNDKTVTHVQHLMERVSSLESRSMAVEQLQDALEQRVQILSDQRERLSEKIDSKVQNIESQTTRINNSMSQLTRKVEELHVGQASGAGLGPSFTPAAHLTSGYHSGGHTGSLQLPGSGATVTVTPQRIDELQRKVGEVEHSVDRALGSCLEQELRIQLLERATYDGVLLWKIDEFDRRRREAIDGTTMSLYSTPFYTGRHGYKMCARIYLNGDGMGKNTHLSFFFVVMRGPFDGLLQWPFKQKVTLTLLNQSGKKHVSDSFRPDPNSSSFQRPGRREMNIASGCPMFIRIEHLLNGGFVKDDCIYVRVVVDTSDLPKVPG